MVSLHPSLHPSRLGPSTGGRTWPRSPRRGGCSSLGEWPGGGEGGSWETQNSPGGRIRGGILSTFPWDGVVGVGSGGLWLLLSGGLIPASCSAWWLGRSVSPAALSPPRPPSWHAHRRLLLAGQMSGPCANRASLCPPQARGRHGAVLGRLGGLPEAPLQVGHCQHLPDGLRAQRQPQPGGRGGVAALPQGEVPEVGGTLVRSPGWGDAAVDPSSPLPLPHQGGKPRAGHRGCTRRSHHCCARGRVPWRGAQLLCDAPWGHKGRLFLVSHLAGPLRCRGRARGHVGTDVSWA